MEEVASLISGNPITICVCYASWKGKGSHDLLAALKAEPFSQDVHVVLLSMDHDEEQEVALGLDMKEIPSVKIYKKGGKLYSTLMKDDLTMDKIRQIVSNIRLLTTLAAPTDSEKLMQAVSQSYAGTLKGTQGEICVIFGRCPKKNLISKFNIYVY